MQKIYAFTCKIMQNILTSQVILSEPVINCFPRTFSKEEWCRNCCWFGGRFYNWIFNWVLINEKYQSSSVPILKLLYMLFQHKLVNWLCQTYLEINQIDSKWKTTKFTNKFCDVARKFDHRKMK